MWVPVFGWSLLGLVCRSLAEFGWQDMRAPSRRMGSFLASPALLLRPLTRSAPIRTPEEGLTIRESHDAESEPFSRLEGGIELSVIEREGAWARVRAEGVEGWVDGRRLLPIEG